MASIVSVTRYQVHGPNPLPDENVATLLSKYVGERISLDDLARAAALLQLEYQNRGQGTVTVAIARQLITNGVVTLNVFPALVPQVLISGKRYAITNLEELLASSRQSTTNVPAPSNPPPTFVVSAYEVRGDTLLSDATLTSILTKYTGTNIGVAEILKAGSELQAEYRIRGYPTVKVTIPQQQITNGIVKLRIFQGRLANMEVINNRFFSSNNVMRALPSLRTNLIINKEVFQGELDRANANQDRQIYPELTPGPVENTTTLVLKVRDQLPLHAKIELGNQSSPGTPELRVNGSAAYNNLWQLEHSAGIQYSFSPEQFKPGDDWNFYDSPLVANYSGFYRLPLGNPSSIDEMVSSQQGTFGYDEASRKFKLPPASSRPEINVYGSRSTIDTGVQSLETTDILNIPGVRRLTREDVQQDITINQGLGTRFSAPAPEMGVVQSTYSIGFDYKDYDLTSHKTNIFTDYEITFDENGKPNPPVISRVTSPVPTTHGVLKYLPVSLRWDGNERDATGNTAFGAGFNFNVWHSGTVTNVQTLSGSRRSSGKWVTATFNASRDQMIATNWILTLKADGQIASEPLISNEQFGVGGLAGVRGYREGEVFGDSGWRVSLEQKTPPYVVGMVYGKAPLSVRGSVYIDYGEDYLLDRSGRDSHLRLWGIGAGAIATIGPHFDARLLVTWPLLGTTTTEAGQPRLDFTLTAEF